MIQDVLKITVKEKVLEKMTGRCMKENDFKKGFQTIEESDYF